MATTAAVTSAPPATAPSATVRGAIARAAAATGVDFNYLLAQARLESSFDPTARATGSSAAGLYQFTRGTWSAMLARHGDVLSATGASASSANQAQLMALRLDPDASARMAAELAGDNSAALSTVLGRPPTSNELYLAHFLGADGAAKFLSALAQDPGQPAAALFPKAAAANPAIFVDSGVPRTLGAVMTLVGDRMATAMASAKLAAGAPAIIDAPEPIARQFGQVAASVPVAAGASMAETLRATFALGDNEGTATAPGFVRSTYGRLAALGL